MLKDKLKKLILKKDKKNLTRVIISNSKLSHETKMTLHRRN
jgi:hypothetical protein